MQEKGREARKNDSGLKHKTSLLNILPFALVYKQLRVYIKGRRSRIQSVTV